MPASETVTEQNAPLPEPPEVTVVDVVEVTSDYEFMLIQSNWY
jgi:hypothetical protein